MLLDYHNSDRMPFTGINDESSLSPQFSQHNEYDVICPSHISKHLIYSAHLFIIVSAIGIYYHYNYCLINYNIIIHCKHFILDFIWLHRQYYSCILHHCGIGSVQDIQVLTVQIFDIITKLQRICQTCWYYSCFSFTNLR